MRILPVVLFLLLLPHLLISGNKKSGDTLPPPPRHDTLYIHDYRHLLTVRAFGLIQDTRLVIREEESGNIIFKPNLPFKLGFAGYYRWFGLGLSFYSPVSFVDTKKNGETSRVDLRINLYSNIVALEAHFQRFRGFYISNFPGPGEGAHFTNPTMLVYSIGIDGLYLYNHKRFSFLSSYFQNEWQKKSAGSLVIRAGVHITTLDAPGGILPDEFIATNGFGTIRNYSKGTLTSLNLTPGYAYNLVILKRCYLHATVMAGPAYNLMADRSEGTRENLDVFSLQISLRGSLGYNGNKFHAGFSAVLHGFQPLASKDSNFYFDVPQYRIWAGTRFDVFRKNRKKNSTFDAR